MLDPTVYINSAMLPLIVVLYFIGLFVKSIEKIPNKYIPFILLVISIITCICVLGFTYSAFIQSVLIAGTATFSNEVIKQTKEILSGTTTSDTIDTTK